MNRELEPLRQSLEELSLEILERLNTRAKQALEIGRIKQRLQMPIRDAHREAELLDHLAKRNTGPLDDATVRTLFRHVLDACVAVMEEPERRELRVGVGGGPPVSIEVRGHRIGPGAPCYIAGPCSVENEEQIEEAAKALARLGVGFLRGGAFKPRTSPYAFQGLGEPALRMLRDAARRHDLAVVTEATSPSNAALVAEYADVLQIGARNMFNYDLLRAVGQTGKPVLLKRSFSASLDEWLNAAEYIALAGSDQIILCERGIRTFARETRSTLDLSIVPLALAASRLPVVVDVSHAAGRRDLLLPLACSAFAVGAQAVMVEVHPDPDVALSDSEQQITLESFAAMQSAVVERLRAAATALSVVSSRRKS